MLTGEWGCGKTYLINNELKEKLQDTHVILRVSLFGMATVEEVKSEVKKKWLSSYVEEKGGNSEGFDKAKKYGYVAKNIYEKYKDFIPGTVRAAVDSVFSINLLDFVKIEPEKDGKKVVLVFDDLERANIHTTDLLGCINDYCENMGISTIVVANEDKIQSDDGEKIKYYEIKEKIIQRTVHHQPDYKSIVESVIYNLSYRSESYRELLSDGINEISALFSGNTINGNSLDDLIEKCNTGKNRQEIEKENKRLSNLLKQRPHNIRSLKCALQDFYRIFVILEDMEIGDKQEWLLSFLAYVFASRAGLVKRDEEYGTLFSDGDVSKLYPGFFNERYITPGIKRWILDGEWVSEAILGELSFTKARYVAITPEEIVRTNRIVDVEEDDIKKGFPILIQQAYAGGIELDDYVHLLTNSCWARHYEIILPEIDWEKVKEGVVAKIQSLLETNTEPAHTRVVIGDESKNDFLDEEWAVYECIKAYRNEDRQILENNKRLLIKLLKTDPLNALAQIKNKRLACIDKEMAEAILDAFPGLSNAAKNNFVSYFRSIINSVVGNSRDYNANENIEGLTVLKAGLELFHMKCKETGQSVAACHTKHFVQVVDEFLAD